jgi:hypothetical protein
VTFRRFAIAVLFAVAAVLSWRDWRKRHPPPRPDLEVFDVAARARQISTESPEAISLTDVYDYGEGGSAHLHIFGKGVTCQLHIHESSEEATIPVMGAPRVTQRFGVDGAIREKSATYAEGTMIVSPPNCAHEWANTSQTGGHASLVFTLGTGFSGNLFVAPSDARILTAKAPTIVDPQKDLEAFQAGSDRVREVKAPVTSARIEEVLSKDSFDVAAIDETVVFLYAIAGQAHVEAPERIAFPPETLVVVRTPRALKVVADGGAAIAFYLVEIPKRAHPPKG